MIPPQPCSRRSFLRGAFAATALGAGAVSLGSCSDQGSAAPGPMAAPKSPSGSASPVDAWAPRPLVREGLSCLATQEGDELLLHTSGGDVPFWGGVTLGAWTPGHVPGAMSATAADYRRWLPMLADLGVRVARVADVHPPEFYAQLREYNAAHPAAPLYLVQGVRLPESASAPGSQLDLYARSTVQAMQQQVRDAVAAVHGRLQRSGKAGAGRPVGRWSADVSAWTAAWLVDVPGDPLGVQASDRRNRKATPHEGRFFRSAAKATPTEHWLAARLDELAAEAARLGVSVPIAVGNTAATDPLRHPQDGSPTDVAQVDPDHVVATAQWPAGTFAAYEADPFAPAFLRTQPEYQQDTDPYRAYLLDLKKHHRGRPLVVSSFGVSSALGSSDTAPNDRDSGHHTEQDAMRIDADLLRMMHGSGLAGGFLTAWQDDWTATSWNTVARTLPVPPARRGLTHDPLTAAQWTGLLTTESARAGERVVHEAPHDGLQRVTVDNDASWLYLTFDFAGRITSPVELGFDIFPGGGLRLPGGSGEPVHDVALRFVPTMSTVLMFVRTALDPLRFDGLPAVAIPRGDGTGWNLQRLLMDGPRRDASAADPEDPEFSRVGEMQLGTWDPASPEYDSCATWNMDRHGPDTPAVLRFRVPFSMLGAADPSARQFLTTEFTRPTLATVPTMQVTVETSTPGSPVSFPLTWKPWNSVRVTERLKAGVDEVATAMAQVMHR